MKRKNKKNRSDAYASEKHRSQDAVSQLPEIASCWTSALTCLQQEFQPQDVVLSPVLETDNYLDPVWRFVAEHLLTIYQRSMKVPFIYHALNTKTSALQVLELDLDDYEDPEEVFGRERAIIDKKIKTDFWSTSFVLKMRCPSTKKVLTFLAYITPLGDEHRFLLARFSPRGTKYWQVEKTITLRIHNPESLVSFYLTMHAADASANGSSGAKMWLTCP
jgi:hypothetical protein